MPVAASAIERDFLQCSRQTLRAVLSTRSSTRDNFSHRRDELHRHFHRRVRRELIGGLILRYRLVRRLRLVVFKHPAHARLIPPVGVA